MAVAAGAGVPLGVQAERLHVGCETVRYLLGGCRGVVVKGDRVRLEPWLEEALRQGFGGEECGGIMTAEKALGAQGHYLHACRRKHRD